MSIYRPSSDAEQWLYNLAEPITNTTLQRAFAAGYGDPDNPDLGHIWVSRYYGSIVRTAAALAFDAGRKHAFRTRLSRLGA